MKSDLVFLTPNTREPFTTSEVIARMTGVTHRKLRELISKYRAEIETFGRLPRYRGGGDGGMNKANYPLNEQQATFLMTLLKNTPVVIAFKAELVRQFYAMRQELSRVKDVKAERKAIRADMTDAIKALPDSPHKAMKYRQYTDLAYMLALGKTAKQLRIERGADRKATASDYMTAYELERVADKENRIAVLLGIGMTYQAIKAALTAGTNAKLTA